MATRTFVGDGTTKNWSDTAAWVEGVVPTAVDDVVFSTNTASSVLTIDGTSGSPSLCRSIDTTGYTRTITLAAAKQLNVGDPAASGAGAFVATAGMTFAPATTSLIKFVSTTGNTNVTWGGYTYGDTTYDGVGGKWIWQDAYKCGSGRVVTLTNGHLDTNSQTASTGGSSPAFSSNNSNTRALTMGTTSWGVPNGSNWDITVSTGMTLSAASSTITFSISTGTNFFAGGGLTWGTLSNTTLTTGTFSLKGANNFTTLTLSTGAGVTSTYSFEANQTVSGTFTGNGNSVINRAYYRSNVVGTARTISAGTFTFTNIDLQDMTKAGAGSGNISAISGGSGDCTGNTGWTFTTPANQYWVASGGTSTGSESAVTRWATSSGGTAGTGRSPLPQDTAMFDASSIDAGSRTITQDKVRIGAHNWSNVTNTPAWSKATTCSLYGTVTMVAGMTNTGSNAITYMGQIASDLTLAAATLSNQLTIDCATGSLNLTADSTINSTLQVTSGSLLGALYTLTQASGNLTTTGGTVTLKGLLSTGTHNYNGGTITIGSSGITGGALVLGGGTFTLNGASTTMTGNVTLTSGTWNLNADYTTSSTTLGHGGSSSMALNLTDATLTIGTAIVITGNQTAGSGGSFTFS